MSDEEVTTPANLALEAPLATPPTARIDAASVELWGGRDGATKPSKHAPSKGISIVTDRIRWERDAALDTMVEHVLFRAQDGQAAGATWQGGGINRTARFTIAPVAATVDEIKASVCRLLTVAGNKEAFTAIHCEAVPREGVVADAMVQDQAPVDRSPTVQLTIPYYMLRSAQAKAKANERRVAVSQESQR